MRESVYIDLRTVFVVAYTMLSLDETQLRFIMPALMFIICLILTMLSQS